MSEWTEPRWLRAVALLPALAIAAFGAVALLSADAGIYSPAVAFPLGAAAFAVLIAAARPLLRKPAGTPSTSATRSAWAVLALAIADAIWNALNASQHVLINRDGGLYLNAGKWIAEHGNLSVPAVSGPFASNPAVVTSESTGMTLVGHRLEFSLSHMLPSLLAEAQNIGGDHLMFVTVPLLGGLALLAFYLLASRVTRSPVAALGATACLAFIMPQVSFSRDTTSEIPTQVLLFTALWMLCDPETWRSRRTALCAGIVLGLVQAMHVDGLAFFVGLPLVYATVWLHGRGRERRALREAIIWSAAGTLVGVALSFFDLGTRNHDYFTNLRANLAGLVAGIVVVVVAASGLIVLARRRELLARVQRARAPLATAVGVTTLIGGFGAWWLRPHLQQEHGKPNPMVAYVQRLNHLPIQPARVYAELSVRWIGWYLGPVTLALTLVVAAVVARSLVRGSAPVPTQSVAFLLGPPTLLYLWRPRITPDHIWATRRFLPAVFPGVILLFFCGLCWVARSRPETRRKVVAVVLGIAAIAFPLWTVHRVSRMTEQRGDYAVVQAACRMLGPNSAVVTLDERRSVLYEVAAQTLRSFCNIPVAVMPGPANKKGLRDLARSWSDEGRRLFVLAEFPGTIESAVPGATLRATPLGRNRHMLELTLTRRPSHYAREHLRLVAAPVLPNGTG